jgi:hypothetical protein
VELAARFRALPDGDGKASIKLDFMLCGNEISLALLAASIANMPDKMLDDLNAAIGLEEKGL